MTILPVRRGAALLAFVLALASGGVAQAQVLVGQTTGVSGNSALNVAKRRSAPSSGSMPSTRMVASTATWTSFVRWTIGAAQRKRQPMPGR